MREKRDDAADWWPRFVLAAGRWLLLVPELVLIAGLLCAYWALGEPAALSLAIAALTLWFIARSLALWRARAALEAARYDEAAALARLALALYPWSADALAMSGVVALATGQPEQAEMVLRRATALAPGRPSFLAALSGALLAQGRATEAAAIARAAIAAAPEDAVAHLYLAEAERSSGAPAEAVEERLRAGLALAGAPETEAAIRCALGAHLLGEHRIAEASLTLHGAEALFPRCPPARQAELRVRMGELLIAQGQIERAREQFRSVAALDPHGRFSGVAWRAGHLI